MTSFGPRSSPPDIDLYILLALSALALAAIFIEPPAGSRDLIMAIAGALAGRFGIRRYQPPQNSEDKHGQEKDTPR